MWSALRVMLGVLVLWTGAEGYSAGEDYSPEDSRGRPANSHGRQSHSGSIHSKSKLLGLKRNTGKKLDLKDRLFDHQKALKRTLAGAASSSNLLPASMSVPHFSLQREGTSVKIHQDSTATS